MSDNITDIDAAQMTPNGLTAFMKIVVETFREYPLAVENKFREDLRIACSAQLGPTQQRFDLDPDDRRFLLEIHAGLEALFEAYAPTNSN